MKVFSGHANIVESLINDIDIEETDYDGWNALLNASHQGHAAVICLLLDAGASVDQHDLMGWTPLMWACYKNRLEGLICFIFDFEVFIIYSCG